MLLEGKVAIVTGAGQGIGREYAFGLAREGAAVVVADIDEVHGKQVEADLREAGHQALFVRTDVSDEESTKELARQAAEAFGGIDVLVNNAAIYAGLPYESFEEMPVERFDRVMAVAVKGTWLCTRAVAPYMRLRGGGSIVNQGSTAAYHHTPRRMNYNVSKAAVHGMTKSLAKELGADGIRVNCIAPGAIDTEATVSTVPSEVLSRLADMQLVKRQGHVADMVGPLLFLASDQSAFVSGQVLVADGGVILNG
ncbi:MAG: hdhA 1 [Frankiales bacterium]|jgi:3-oxoacyl-[acyl-carrier protein] reductase|nr:hdhA 1 [Frankiales bacterium]